MDTQLLDNLEGGATVVTATNRLAASLKTAYAARQQAAGRTAWPSPDVLPWGAWLTREWTDARDFGLAAAVPLAPHQEQALWEAVIRADPGAEGLLQAAGAAASAAEAWAVVQQYHLTLPDDPGDDPDTAAFGRWRAAFAARLAAGGWTTRAELPDQLAALYAGGGLPLPRRLSLAGFDEVTPQQAALLTTLEGRGVAVDRPGPGDLPEPGRVTRRAYADSAAEVRAAAAWARQRLADGAEGPIGIVVPALGELRDPLERALADALHPRAAEPDRAPEQPAYNLSLGRPIAEAPVVHAALRALELALADLPVTELGPLLRSPFLAGGESEAGRRARLDAALRAFGEHRANRHLVAHIASQTDGEGNPRGHNCPQLTRALARARQRAEAAAYRQRPSAWAALFADLLQDLGWPGERALDSAEYQTVVAWQERLLDPFAALDPVTGELSASDALGRLRRLARETVFQPQGGTAPVQVLGILEAAGQSFEALWVLGMHEEAWPPPARPNPFLPWRLQRDHDLPHATPERELAFARRTLDRLLGAAPAVVVSHPRREGDRELAPSPLIRDYAETPGEAAPARVGARAWEEAMRREGRRETVADADGPGLAAGARAPGGTALFRDQAACPFRAFAVHRLGARPLETPAPGLDARDRGILAHALLERLWGELESQAALLALDEAGVHDLCRRAAAGAVAEAARGRPDAFPERFAELETERLAELAAQWLALERQRAPFSVAGRESRAEVAVGGLTLDVRLDRVDRLADGRLLLVDYKTGRAEVGAWAGERPDEPQLPLYAVGAGEGVAGVAFARLKAGELGFAGVAAADGVAPGVTPAEAAKAFDGSGWDDLLGQWRAVLDGLGAEIRGGAAAVTPRDGPAQTCAYCHLGAVCRIQEHTDATAEPVGEETGRAGDE